MQEASQKSLTGNKYVYPSHRGRDWPSGGTQVSEWLIVQRINQPVTSSEAISTLCWLLSGPTIQTHELKEPQSLSVW